MTGEVYRELGEAAWAWVPGQVRDDEGSRCDRCHGVLRPHALSFRVL